MALGSFNNPIVGSSGDLTVDQIQSPNFSIAAKTGWQIQKNGDAYFYDITATGITTSTVVVEGATGGVFVYSGTPAHGNLIGSWAGQSGTDAYSNSYPQGLNVSLGAISGVTISGATITSTTFEGTDFIINSSGSFFYSGTPGTGNLTFAVTSASSDSFGNKTVPGLSSYNSSGYATSVNSGFIEFYTGSLGAGWSTSAIIETSGSGGLILQASGSAYITLGSEVDGIETTTLSINGQSLVIPQSNPTGISSAPTSYDQTWGDSVVSAFNNLRSAVNLSGLTVL